MMAAVVAAATSVTAAGDRAGPPGHPGLAAGDTAAFDRFVSTGVEPDAAAVDRLWRWSDRHRAAAAEADDDRAAYVHSYLATSQAVPGVATADWLPALRAAADRGDVACRGQLGTVLLSGTFATPDAARGKALLVGAADAGEPVACSEVGSDYLQGQPGFVGGRGAALPYLHRGAAAGNRTAVAELMYLDLTSGGYDRSAAAQADLAAAAEAGEPFPQVLLGRWFTAGAPPDRRDPARGFEYFRAAVAATHGHRTDWVCSLAELYDDGNGTPADPATATDLYEQAYAVNGVWTAGLALAERYTAVDATPEKAARALVLLRQLADAGCHDADRRLAHFYLQGLLVDRDVTRARQWVVAAGDANTSAAMLRLFDAKPATAPTSAPATAPAAGSVVSATSPARPPTPQPAATTQPDDLAAFWAWKRLDVNPADDAVGRLLRWSAPDTHDPQRLYVRAVLHLQNFAGDRDVPGSYAALAEAAAAGYPPAMASYGSRLLGDDDVPPDPARGRALLDRACAAGDVNALVDAGYEYLYGGPTYAKDVDRAMAAFLAAAGQGDATAMIGVARVQVERKQYDAAVKTLTPLCDQGNSSALVDAADWLMVGTVLPKDPDRARELVEKAVAAGRDRDARAIAAMGFVCATGVGGPADLPRAAGLYRRAYALGSNYAGCRLADCYLNGFGIPADPVRAAALYRTLADHGNAVAAEASAELSLSGIGGPRDVPAARRRLTAAAGWGLDADPCRRLLHLLDLTPIPVPTTAPAGDDR